MSKLLRRGGAVFVVVRIHDFVGDPIGLGQMAFHTALECGSWVSIPLEVGPYTGHSFDETVALASNYQWCSHFD
jgi:hypothetical protein